MNKVKRGLKTARLEPSSFFSADSASTLNLQAEADTVLYIHADGPYQLNDKE